METIGLRDIPQYPITPKHIPRFDYYKDYDGYVSIFQPYRDNKPLTDKPEFFIKIKFGALAYLSTIMELGDRDLLTGKALEYYKLKKVQLERTMINNFQEHDVFISEDQKIMVRVVDQTKDDHVIFETMKVPKEKEGKAWDYPSNGRSRMPVYLFAQNVTKLNPKRYSILINPRLLIPPM